MIWLLAGVSLMTYPLVYAAQKYGGPWNEAVERMMFNSSLSQIVQMQLAVRFGGVIAGYGLMKVLT